jgi:hypothetical protein
MNRDKTIKELLRKTYRQGPDPSSQVRMEGLILDNASRAMKQSVIDNPRPSRTTIWRTIMDNKVTRYSAAAVIGIAALVLLNPLGTSRRGVALAEVQARVAQVETMVLKGQTTFTHITDPNISVQYDNVKYISRDHGFVEEGYVKGALSYRVVLSRQTKQSLLLLTSWKKCLRFPCTEEQIQVMEKLTPTGVVGLFLETRYKKLGRSQINGVEVEGFQVEDLKPIEDIVPKFLCDIQEGTATIWVGTKELLPVRGEADMVIGANFWTDFMDVHCHEITVLDSYDVELDPNLFDTSIPEGYTGFKLTDFIPDKLGVTGLGILPTLRILWEGARRTGSG